MVVRNESTRKTYNVTREEYERYYKGKQNWSVVDDSESPAVVEQTISNTLVVEKIEPEKKERRTRKRLSADDGEGKKGKTNKQKNK